MTDIQLQELDNKLQTWRQAKKDWNNVKELCELATAKGHSDGRWQPTLNINYQVAYQKNVGGNNYHSSEVLNREIHKLISTDLEEYRTKAIDNIEKRYLASMIDLA
jgi:hypothetical protein